MAANEEEIVALWQQRGISQTGYRFEGPVQSVYRLGEGKFARAQVFYFNTAAVALFLAQVEELTARTGSH